ncbi:MAG: hypothetical protein WBI07_00890 [Mobilitalea sp.]
MEWLLVVGVMAVFGAIAFFMHRVGISFRKPVSFREKKYIHTKERPCTIIFGKSELADKLIAELKRNKIRYLQIEEVGKLDKAKYCSNLFAVGGNDIKNLMMCLSLARLNATCNCIAICNLATNQNLYEKNNICYLMNPNPDPEALYRLMFPPVYETSQSNLNLG